MMLTLAVSDKTGELSDDFILSVIDLIESQLKYDILISIYGKSIHH